jgi:hypothetical protein
MEGEWRGAQLRGGRWPHPLAHMAMLSTAFMGLTFAVFTGYGPFAAVMREHVIARPGC